MEKDLISVIIPVYNNENYFERCIKSVIEQTYNNIEIIIINDYSIDNVESIILKYKELDKRIKYYKNTKNEGVGYTRNLGISKSQGKYLYFLDSDDYIEKNCLEVLHSNINEDNSFSCMLKGFKEAKERDHRKIGKDLKIFMTSELVGRRLPLWLPNGYTLWRTLQNYITDKEIKYGYSHVHTPDLGSVELYKTSGHWDHYKDDMFPAMEMDNEAYVLRPMNCPHHMVMYKNFLHSYKDLPIRIAEIANDFRYEAAGAVKGIERARSFTQNDSHIFCTPEQIETEFKGVLDLIMDVYKDFGFKNYKCRLSLRDPEDKEKYFQDDEMWNNAENDLRKVLNDIGIDYIEAKGEAAFYGPKLDILIKPAIGNEVALSTIQLDFLLPRRFELYYIDTNGEKKTPVVIHRAILGSLDRFIALLLEETKGALPLWLAPVGINIIPVNKEYHLEYATSIYEMLKDANYRIELDDSDEKLSYKMRESQIRKIPITLILGQKEVDEKTISFRLFGSTETTTMSIEEFKKYIENLIVNKK